MSNYNMWPILHSRPRGTSSSSRIPLTTGEEVPLQVVYTNTDISPSLGRVDDDLALVPLTTRNLETFDQVTMSASQTNGAVYSVPPQETPTPPLATAKPFARTASGYFADYNDVYRTRLPLRQLTCQVHRSAVEKVEEVLKPHFSSHKIRRDLSFVNISAVPIPVGIVWDKVMFDKYGPAEVIQVLYVLKLSMNDIVIPGIVSDDWDVKTVDSMMTELQCYTVYENTDVYQFKENYGDMFCYNY
ncbi:hypothetical protein NDU88_002466 [Pleurodeles waltl]|uniref:Uncharacterized protein n=1 Tax=Pleurodeles waltl TaxID=8319 RepID=A0AAV7SB06_PLEWA|nr:hypothetical protein NDU88_002466 [Pleurodeles waltl]